MAYTALARAWRPKKFSELVGQEHVLRALMNALESGRVHHAFLFTGTRGVGKTTIARIFAKCLNCEKGVTSEPCGECANCREIDTGRSVDLIEVDAASRTKVDDTRELLDNVQYAPTRARYKVYLIDEVHMLSAHSFNALLKTLEEPPPHVKFLLATTDPQKLPVTVLSRCLQFNLKRLPVTQIADHMKHILQKEGISFEAGGIRLVAQAADGSMRDGLSLLDQLIAFGGGSVTESAARAMLGTISRDHVVKLAELLVAADASELMKYAQSLDQWAPDYAQVLDELAALLARVAIKQTVKDYEGDELYAPELLTSLAKGFSAEDVQLYYQTAIIGRRDIALAPEPRVGFEMTLLRMLAFRPTGDAVQTTGTPSASQAGRGSDAARAAARGSATGTSRAEAASAGAGSRAGAGAGRSGGDAGGAASARTGASSDGNGVTTAEAAAGSWAAIINSLDLQGAARQLASNCALLGRRGSVVWLALDPRHQHVKTQRIVDALAQALSRHFGETVRIEFQAAAPGAETPAQAGQRASMEELDSARQSLEADPVVQGLRERFGGTVVPESVRPVK
jgi:DNA polymerase-3 subunit gamma/tau